ncbi:hypothetical protein ACFLU6_02810 [Acidobacteriota bacterium]
MTKVAEAVALLFDSERIGFPRPVKKLEPSIAAEFTASLLRVNLLLNLALRQQVAALKLNRPR